MLVLLNGKEIAALGSLAVAGGVAIYRTVRGWFVGEEEEEEEEEKPKPRRRRQPKR